MDVFAPETVIVRVRPGVLSQGVELVRTRRWLMARAMPLALACGQDLVVVVDELAPTLPIDREPGVELLIRRAQRMPSGDAASRRVGRGMIGVGAGCAPHGLLELLVLDDGRVWGSFLSPARAPAAVVVREFPCRGVALANDVIHSVPSLQLPRTSRLLGLHGLAEAWSALHVAIVGVGRSGSLIADALCAQGVRRFTLIDSDVLEASNLDGMSLVRSQDVGKSKVESVGRALCDRFPEISVLGVCDEFPSPRSLNAVAAAEVLVTTVDQDRPRLFANQIARRLLQLHVDVGTGADGRLGQGADVRLLSPTGLCLLCLGGVADVENRAGRVPGNSSRGVNATAVHLAVEMMISALAEHRPGSSWVRVRSTSRPVQVTSEVLTPAEGRADCPWCGRLGESIDFPNVDSPRIGSHAGRPRGG